MSSVKFLKVKGTWREVADAARTTIRQDEGVGEPSARWKKRILLAEHSPIRKLCFNWKWLDLPYWVSVHIVRHKYGIEHSLLHVELTESMYSDNPGQIERTLQELHDNGFHIELDDFGSGYSSLTSLNTLTLDVMKVDMSLIRQASATGDYSILRFASLLADNLRLKTVVEGVETAEQVAALKVLGCDYIQGYYFSKPLPAKEFEEYLAVHNKQEVRA